MNDDKRGSRQLTAGGRANGEQSAMVSANPNRENVGQYRQDGGPPAPPLVDRILIFFYLLLWANLLSTTYSRIARTTDGDYGYLVPVSLYMLLFAVYFAFNRSIYRRVGGVLSEQLWGYDNPQWAPIAFVVASTGLVTWASFEDPNFFFLYIPLIAATFGMLDLRFSLPVMGLQVVGVAYFMGLFHGFQRGLSPDAVVGVTISIIATVLSFVLITLLIRSHLVSERLVRDLQATKSRLEESLLKEQEVAVLRERNRMAREMHDVLGHSLALVAVKIEAAQRLQAVDADRAAAELDATKELVRQSMADLRVSLADLRSPAFEAGGKPLSEALEEWATRTAREGGFTISCNIDPGLGKLPAPLQDAIWRVGREAVLNVVKHARAKQVELNVFTKDGAIYLTTADDGVGIPNLAEGNARLEVEGHYGIRGMRERLEALGGSLTVKPSRTGQGTMVIAKMPVPLESPPSDAPPQQKSSARLVPSFLGKKLSKN